MATWHILQGETFDPPDDGPVVEWPAPDNPLAEVLSTADAESDPKVADLRDQVLQCLPLGAAWRTPDGQNVLDGSEMANYWQGFAALLAPLYRLIYQATLEGTVSTISQSLEDWERDFGLPSACFGPDQSYQTRLGAVRSKELSPAMITPGDYLNLALSLGYPIVIEEPTPFDCIGNGAIDSRDESLCGWDSECASQDLAVQWVVHLEAGPSQYCEAGIGECGVDLILDWPIAEALECVLRPLIPAWSILIFNYSETGA